MWRSPIVLNAFILALLSHVTHSSVQDGLVSTPWGKIRGVPKTSPSGQPMTSFEGIPYAKPPLGDLRFSKPVPSTGSNATIYLADTVQPSCLMTNATRESEDCLYLDLYVPHAQNPQAASPMAVMVYIHGGGFLVYGGEVIPARLLSKNVIVAFVHYRLGAMGFLSTGDGVLKGNYGLWDQRLAIQWVRDNAAAFGGDPNSITIFGESAGSASVAYQILAPMGSKGLFQRAILQSGAATASWALNRRPRQAAQALAVSLGCSVGSSSSYLASCLRKVDAVRLQEEAFAIWQRKPGFQHIGDFMFVPVVDHDFVADEPLQLIKNSTYLQTIGALDIDVIIGVLNNEANLVKRSLTFDPNIPKPPKFGDYFEKEIIPTLLNQRYGVSTKEVESVVKDFYLKDIPTSSLTAFSVSDAFVDAMFVIPALEFIEALSKATTTLGHRYFYYFDYCPSFSPVFCMGHGLDLAFMFATNTNTGNVTISMADKHVSVVFVSLLTSFAQTGIPTANNTPAWRQFSPQSQSYLRISSQPENKVKLFPRRLRLWTETIPLLYSTANRPVHVIG